MKRLFENWNQFLNEESELSEMATAWKERGLKGPYKLETGEMGGALDVLEQYVTPDDQRPTHFIHFGSVKEEAVDPVLKPMSALSTVPGTKDFGTVKPDPKLGPAKYVPAELRQSKRGAQFKFGVNPRSKFNTPIGIYSYPLSETIYNQLKTGQLPFAAESPFIMLFKPTTDLPVIYTSEDVPDDEYGDYVAKLFSQETIDNEQAVQLMKIGDSFAAKKNLEYKKYLEKQDLLDRMGVSYLIQGQEEMEEKALTQTPWHPRDLPIVRDAEHESDQHLADTMRGVVKKTNIGYIWNLARNAADLDSKRWSAILRKIGIGGIVDDKGAGFIHSFEPEQAVFFATREGPEKNLELVKVFPNTLAPKKIEKRETWEEKKELIMSLRKIAKEMDIRTIVRKHAGGNADILLSYLGKEFNDLRTFMVWNYLKTLPWEQTTETDQEMMLKVVKEEQKGAEILYNFFVDRFARRAKLWLENWNQNFIFNTMGEKRYRDMVSKERGVNVPTVFKYTLKKIEPSANKQFESDVTPETAGARLEHAFIKITKFLTEYQQFAKTKHDQYVADLQSPESVAQLAQRHPKIFGDAGEEESTVQESIGLNYLGSKWDWMVE